MAIAMVKLGHFNLRSGSKELCDQSSVCHSVILYKFHTMTWEWGAMNYTGCVDFTSILWSFHGLNDHDVIWIACVQYTATPKLCLCSLNRVCVFSIMCFLTVIIGVGGSVMVKMFIWQAGCLDSCSCWSTCSKKNGIFYQCITIMSSQCHRQV